MGCYMAIYNPTNNKRIQLFRSAFKMADLLGIKTEVENCDGMGWHSVKEDKIKEVFEILKSTTDRTINEEDILSKLDMLLKDLNTEDTYDVYFDY